ncbi:MAG: PfkB family carbohydrate kinase [Methanolobus sp.]
MILYDPNFRRSQLPHLEKLKTMIQENIGCSSIVRASDEDMKLIFDCNNFEEACDVVNKSGCRFLIYTSSSRSVFLKTPLFSKQYPVPELKTVSTIGAGDSFNAGIVFTLYSKSISTLEDLSEELWDDIIENAIGFASDVCMSNENYISNTFASGLKKI